MDTLIRIGPLVAFAFLLATGQILFKLAALKAGQQGLSLELINGWFVAALVLYGVATVLWVWLLTFTPLSYAYPFAALGFVIVPIASTVIFNETLTPGYGVGALLIVSGILTVAWSK